MLADKLVDRRRHCMAELTQPALILGPRSEPGFIGQRAVSDDQLVPFSKQSLLARRSRLLLEPDCTSGCSVRNSRNDMPYKVERCSVDELQSARLHRLLASTIAATYRSSLIDKAERCLFIGEKDNPAEDPLRQRKQSQLQLGKDPEGALGADEQIERIHTGAHKISRRMLERRHRIVRQRQLDRAPLFGFQRESIPHRAILFPA